MILTNARERARFIRFGVVGSIGFVIDFGIYNLLIQVFHVHYLWANVCSFSFAVVSNFLGNRYWTYPDSRSKPIRKQLFEFFLVNLIGVAIRTLILSVLNTILSQRLDFETLPYALPIDPEFLVNNFAFAAGIVVVLFWNFFANRFWTYADVES